MITVLSLFDGLGGARIALDRLGIPCKYYASEIDKYAIKIALKNYPDIIQLGDIANIKTKDLPQIDLLIGGSPCQDLSVAKKDRKGLQGKRSGLFWEYVRLLKKLKPKYFVLENVNSMKKTDKQIITNTLCIEPIMINSALLTAQNRKRLYWTNIKNIQQPEDRHIYLKDIIEENVDRKYYIENISIIPSIKSKKTNLLNFLGGIRNKDWAKDGKKFSRNFGQGDRVYSIEGKSATLSANGDGRGAKTGLYVIPHGFVKRRYKKVNKYPTLCGQSPSSKHLIACVAQRGRYNKDGSTSQKLEPRFDGKTNTLTSIQKDNAVLKIDTNKSYIRKLTPIECERLQGLPDNYTEGVSNTQRYKMVDNGFTIDVVAHILKEMKE